jgi:hypothetical protein
MPLPEMLPVSWESLRMLLRPRSAPCVTIVQPTQAPPRGEGTVTALRHLIDRVQLSLAATRSRDEVEAILAPWRALEMDPLLWSHGGDGFAGFGARGEAWLMPLAGPLTASATVGSRFRTLAMVEHVAAIQRCRVLVISSRLVRVLDGVGDGEGKARLVPVPLSRGTGQSFPDGSVSRDEIVALERQEPHRVLHGSGPAGIKVHGGFGSRAEGVAADTHRFFHDVAGMVATIGSPPSAGFLLVGLPRAVAEFTDALPLARHPFVRMTVHPHLVGKEELAHVVGDVLRASRRRREIALTEAFQGARVYGRGTGDFSDIARAAAAGQVGTLLLESGRRESGSIDSITGTIDFPSESEDRDIPGIDAGDDLYGALAELVLAHSGDVVCLPASKMPTRTGVAAIFRWVKGTSNGAASMARAKGGNC